MSEFSTRAGVHAWTDVAGLKTSHSHPDMTHLPKKGSLWSDPIWVICMFLLGPACEELQLAQAKSLHSLQSTARPYIHLETDLAPIEQLNQLSAPSFFSYKQWKYNDLRAFSVFAEHRICSKLNKNLSIYSRHPSLTSRTSQISFAWSKRSKSPASVGEF